MTKIIIYLLFTVFQWEKASKNLTILHTLDRDVNDIFPKALDRLSNSFENTGHIVVYGLIKMYLRLTLAHG